MTTKYFHHVDIDTKFLSAWLSAFLLLFSLAFFRFVWVALVLDVLCPILKSSTKGHYCLKEVRKSKVGFLEAVVFEGKFGVCNARTG
jgi:hypothetical protein